MASNGKDFLMNLPNCGVLDLKLIDGVSYDWCNILDGERGEDADDASR